MTHLPSSHGWPSSGTAIEPQRTRQYQRQRLVVPSPHRLLFLYLLFLLAAGCHLDIAGAFTPPHPSTLFVRNAQTIVVRQHQTIPSLWRLSSSRNNDINNNDDDTKDDDDDSLKDVSSNGDATEEVDAATAWDADVDYDQEWPTDVSSSSSSSLSKSLPDPSTPWDALSTMPQGLLDASTTAQLGIGLTLDPLTQDELLQIQNEARQIIDNAIQDGVNDIAKLRIKMERELQASKSAMDLASDLEGKRQQDILMDKIDTMMGTFLNSTATTRQSTKLAAAASKAMEGTGRGVEIGTWGVLGGRTVLAGSGDDDDDIGSSTGTLLGSVENARRGQAVQEDLKTTISENRILIVADMKQDALAKDTIPALLERLDVEKASKLLPADLVVDVLPPTATMPIGANNAACVLLFLSSLSSGPSQLNTMLDRLLRKTLQAGTGKIGRPPTQLVAITTHGTERYEKFPYSMDNLLGGGKLEKRRQLEETIIGTVRNRITEPALDYTIVKLPGGGDKLRAQQPTTGTSSPTFVLKPGDVLDGPTTVQTAVRALLQAVAYQPAARNATLCIEGVLPEYVLGTSADDTPPETAAAIEEYWQEVFLCLEGPEVWRSTVYDYGKDMDGSPSMVDESYNELVEFLQEWADLLATSKKGLTTPIRVEMGLPPSPIGGGSRAVVRQDGIRLLFLPTKTGTNYASRDEEVQRERQLRQDKVGVVPTKRYSSREGGIAVVVELVQSADRRRAGTQPLLRVRARRCEYGDDAVIKELSEATIIKRLQEALEVWKKDRTEV